MDKANVFASMAFFRRIFDELAVRHPGIQARHHYVDAMALAVPYCDVVVTEKACHHALVSAGMERGMQSVLHEVRKR